MAEETKIQWCDHTFNPWSGCAKISPGCANCYAAVNYSVKIRGVKWGPQGNRIVASESMWKQPLKWNREAARKKDEWDRGVGTCEIEMATRGPYQRPRVFCASLADVFEDWQGPMLNSDQWPLVQIDKRPWTIQVNEHEPLITMQDVRDRLFLVIDATPNLDWLVLTKRPENIAAMMPFVKTPKDVEYTGQSIGSMMKEALLYRRNLWLGTSCENQQTADERIPHLLRVPAAVRFLSCEPLLGPIDLTLNGLVCKPCPYCIDKAHDYETNVVECRRCDCTGIGDEWGIDWVIVGGESGHGARPCDIAWIRSIVEQCREAGVKCFVKQLGASPNEWDSAADGLGGITGGGGQIPLALVDPKGGDPAEWPIDLRVRQFPA